MNPSQQGKPIQDLRRIEILLADNKTVYMNAEPGDVYSVVWVRGESFLRIWNDQPWCRQTSEQWRNDKKFPRIERCFANSHNYPVELIIVGTVHHPAKQNKMSLADGITRTMWLLLHGAEFFPVLCPRNEAEELKRLAGS